METTFESVLLHIHTAVLSLAATNEASRWSCGWVWLALPNDVRRRRSVCQAAGTPTSDDSSGCSAQIKNKNKLVLVVPGLI